MAKTEKKTEIKKGDQVNLVLASGKAAAAVVTGVNDDGTVDLRADLTTGAIIITRAPRDDNGLKPDSWHVAALVTDGENK